MVDLSRPEASSPFARPRARRLGEVAPLERAPSAVEIARGRLERESAASDPESRPSELARAGGIEAPLKRRPGRPRKVRLEEPAPLPPERKKRKRRQAGAAPVTRGRTRMTGLRAVDALIAGRVVELQGGLEALCALAGMVRDILGFDVRVVADCGSGACSIVRV